MKRSFKFLLKGMVAIVLVVSILLSVCSCVIQGIEKSIISKETFKQLSYETEETEEEIYDDVLYGISKETIEYQIQLSVFDYAIYCLAYDLSSGGYDVEKGFAILNENESESLIPGLIFKNGSQVDGIDTCGFVQIVDKSADDGIRLTTEMISQGVVAFSSTDENNVYLVNTGAEIEGFSGIYNGCYFAYQQVAENAVEIDARSNSNGPYYENLDCYDYDSAKWLFKGDIKIDDVFATPLYSNESEEYKKAVEAYNKIIELQNENSKSSTVQTIILFSEEVLNQYLLGQSVGLVNGYSLEELSKIQLEDNQILVITSEGVSIQTLADPGDRAAMGLIEIIASSLAIVGSVFLCIATYGASAAISAIVYVSGACVTAYSLSNIVEGTQNLYYGINGDVTTPSYNPLLEVFKNVVEDDVLGTQLYHIWGFSSGIIQAICVPIGSAINIGKAACMKAKEIAILATRAAVTEIVKIASSTIVSMVVATVTENLLVSANAPSHVAKLLSFSSALLAGAFTYKALDKIDYRYNISGIKNKTSLAVKYKENIAQDDQPLDWDYVVSKGETRVEHIIKNHKQVNPNKPNQTLFADDPIDATNTAWKNRNSVLPIDEDYSLRYEIPFNNVGTNGENYIRIVVIKGTNKLITAYPIFK